MSRWIFLGPFLAVHVLGGCGSPTDVKPTLTSDLELTFADEQTVPCDKGGWQPTGKPAHIIVRGALVTKSCRCEYMTVAPYGCSTSKECESAYDVGSENPQKCDRIGEDAATIESATATTNRADCTVDVTFDASSARGVVQCDADGDVSVYFTLHTDQGDKNEYHHVLFADPSTMCAPPDADGGADADAADDADADADGPG